MPRFYPIFGCTESEAEQANGFIPVPYDNDEIYIETSPKAENLEENPENLSVNDGKYMKITESDFDEAENEKIQYIENPPSREVLEGLSIYLLGIQ